MNRTRKTTSMTAMIIAGLACIIFHSSAAKAGGSLAQAVKSAFQAGNPALLKPYFPSKGKIFISIPAAGASPGNHSPGQAMAVLRRMFKQSKTTAVTVQGGPGNSIRAVWDMKDKTTKKSKSITIYFTVNANKITAIRGER